MAKTFDATTKDLIESDPRAWLLVLFEQDVRSAAPMNVDLSTVTAEADALLQVPGPPSWIAHIEVQST